MFRKSELRKDGEQQYKETIKTDIVAEILTQTSSAWIFY